ncbi:serine/threonine protein kinase [Patescibacteria group bacterium]|nr:serine/threonine protein kinase [Patescibacteria group bacterium]
MTITGILSVGATGIILRAKRPRQEERAVKVLRPDHLDNEVLIKGFAMEAEALSNMTSADRNHHVPTYYSAGITSSGLPFIEMELIGGSVLSRGLGTESPIKDDAAIGALLDVCEALTDLHASGFTHGDVSPPNIMLEDIGGVPRTVLVDFGAARHIDDHTQQESATGGLGYVYMPPEQANGYSAGARTDVFFLGGVLCRLLYGCGPYPQKEYEEKLAAAREGKIEIPPPRRKGTRSRTEGRLRNLIKKATQATATDRHESPAAFADHLRFAMGYTSSIVL